MYKPRKACTSWERLPVSMTIEQAAVLLQLTDGGVRELCRRGVVPAVRLGKEWRIARDALRQCLEGTGVSGDTGKEVAV